MIIFIITQLEPVDADFVELRFQSGFHNFTLVHFNPIISSVAILWPLSLYHQKWIIFWRTTKAQESFIIFLFLVKDSAHDIHLDHIVAL